MKVNTTGLVVAAMAAPEAPKQTTPLSIGSPAIGGKINTNCISNNKLCYL